MVQILFKSWSILKRHFLQLMLLCVVFPGLQWVFNIYFYRAKFIPLDFIFSAILLGGIYAYIFLNEQQNTRDLRLFTKGFDKILSLINIAVTVVIVEKAFNLILFHWNPGIDSLSLTNHFSYMSKIILVLFYGQHSWIMVFILTLVFPVLLTAQIAYVSVVVKENKFIASVLYALRVVYSQPVGVLLGFVFFQIIHLIAFEFLIGSTALWFLSSILAHMLQATYFYALFDITSAKLELHSSDDLLGQFGAKS